MSDIYEDIRKGEKGALVSIVAYLVLSAFKLVCGYLFASSALLADGFNNLTDIVASLAVLIGLRISRKPPDSDHTYGHFRRDGRCADGFFYHGNGRHSGYCGSGAILV